MRSQAPCRRSGCWAAIRSSRCSACRSRRLLRHLSPDDPLDAAQHPSPARRASAARWKICRSRQCEWRAGRRGGMRGGRGKEVTRSMLVNRLSKTPPHRLALRARHLSPTAWGRGIPKLEQGRGRCQAGAPASPPRFLAPTQWGRGGEGEARDGEGVDLGGAGRDAGSACAVSGQGAVPRNRTSPPRPQNPAASTASPRCGRAGRRAGAKGRTTTSTRC